MAPTPATGFRDSGRCILPDEKEINWHWVDTVEGAKHMMNINQDIPLITADVLGDFHKNRISTCEL